MGGEFVVSQTLEQRKKTIAEATEQRYVEFMGGKTKYTSGTVHEINANSSAIEREFYDFYRTRRGEFTPPGQSPTLTTHPTLTSNVNGDVVLGWRRSCVPAT